MSKNHSQKFILLLLLTLTSICHAQLMLNKPKEEINLNHAINIIPIIKPDFTNGYIGPKSITRTVIQGSKGNVWIASWEGIFKYDGKSFTNITKEVSISRFFSVLEDSKGNFWFGSIGDGVYYYDGKTFINYTTKDGLVHDNVKYIYEDQSDNVWFATQGGVSKFDGQSFQNYTTKDGLLHNDSNSILEDKTGKIWIASRGKVSIFENNKFTEYTKENGESFHNVRSIIEDISGDIWIGGEDGLMRYDGKNLTTITNQFVGYIYEDTKSSIWVSIEGPDGWGVTRLDKNPLFNSTLTNSQIWVDKSMVFGILEDDNGGIWFGTLYGACYYDGNTVDCPEIKNQDSQGVQ